MGPSIYRRRCAKRGVRKYRAGAYGLKRSTRVELFCQLFSLCPPVEPAGSYNIFQYGVENEVVYGSVGF